MFLQPNTYTILGIDPGKNLGVCALTIDVLTNEILDVDAITWYLDHHEDDDLDNPMLDRCSKLTRIIRELITTYDPLVIGYEASFMNTRFPKSVIQLSQYVGTIELTIRNTDPWIRLFKYPPKQIKAAVGATGTADKTAMKNTLSKIPSLTSKISLECLSEHAIDAIAIAYVSYLEIKDNPHYLYMLPL